MQNPPISIRPGPELLARLEAIGKAAKPFPVKRHTVILAALEEYAANHAVPAEAGQKPKPAKKKAHG